MSLSFYLAAIETEEEKISFEKIYLTYRKQMLFLALSILKNKPDSEDAVHDAFIGIANNMKTIQNLTVPDDLRNYVLKAAKNASLNILNRKKIRNECTSLYDNEDIADSSFMDALCKKAEYTEVVRAIEKLDDIYRDALYYHFVLDLPIQKISKLLGRNPQTIKKQIYRGKKILLAILSEKGDDIHD